MDRYDRGQSFLGLDPICARFPEEELATLPTARYRRAYSPRSLPESWRTSEPNGTASRRDKITCQPLVQRYHHLGYYAKPITCAVCEIFHPTATVSRQPRRRGTMTWIVQLVGDTTDLSAPGARSRRLISAFPMTARTMSSHQISSTTLTMRIRSTRKPQASRVSSTARCGLHWIPSSRYASLPSIAIIPTAL